MSDNVVGNPKTVLILAYHFPPIGGAGVQRTVKFAKYLPEFGFQPVIVTTGDTGAETRSPHDETLYREIPPRTPVYRPSTGRLTAPYCAHIARAEDRLRGLIGGRSRSSRAWIEACINVGLRAGQDHSPDLVYASLSPFESCPAAEFLARTFGVPWVADLRDPWALDEMMVYSSRWHRAAEIRRMRRELSTARLVIMNTPEATRALTEAMPEFTDRAVTITNGFDAADFSGPPPPKRQHEFRIVHTGHLHSELGARHRRNRFVRRLLGGNRLPVDIETRSHIYLLAALARWRSEMPDMSRHVRLVLAGPMTRLDRLIVEQSGVSDLVDMPGYVDHQSSVDLIRSADLLFLPMHNLPTGEKARLVPGKTYEYLAAGPPILAAVPDGDASDLVKQSQNGDVCRPDDIGGMVASLRARYESWLGGQQHQTAISDFCRRFERRELTRELAARFDRILGTSPSTQRIAGVQECAE